MRALHLEGAGCDFVDLHTFRLNRVVLEKIDLTIQMVSAKFISKNTQPMNLLYFYTSCHFL
jgi:hypothetical protein